MIKAHKLIFISILLQIISLFGVRGLFAQNSITTPTGTPLTIGNNGVKLANLTSASTPSASNNLALSVDASGNIILVPAAASGGGSPTFRVVNTGNTFGGTASGTSLVNGTSNTFIGLNSGYYAGANVASTQNSFYGVNSGLNQTDGAYNTFLGVAAGANNRTGNHNVMIGVNAGFDGAGTVTTKNPSYSTFIGNYAGQNASTIYNTFIGYASGQFSTTGTNNVWIGNFAGGNAGVTNNNSCNFIGDQSGSWTGTNFASPISVVNNLTNATAIGFQSQVIVSNALVLGGVGAYAVKVGIGLNNPAYPLDVKGVVNMRLTQNSPAIKINERDFMGIDENEEFWVSNFKIRYENENQWSDKVFEKDYNLMKINDLDKFITQNKHLPNIPSAKEVVEKGVNNAEITSKLLEKIEEMSLYIIQLEKRISEIEKK